MEIVYEDNHLLIVNKASGELVQGDKTGDEPLSEKLKHYVKEKYNKPGEVFMGVAHRLDRPVTGLVIFARTSKALERLNKMLQQREIKKTYWAIVKGVTPKEHDRIIHHIYKNEKQNKSYVCKPGHADAKEAVLSYSVLKAFDNYSLLAITLETGRHHQIRCQLAAIGCPIKGDLKYGFPRSNADGSISLHARKLEFVHPVSKSDVMVEATPPKDKLWNTYIDELAGGNA